jgi:hypothetical protein
MSAPYNPNIDLQVGRGHGLHLQINRQPVPDSYGALERSNRTATNDRALAR